MNAGVASSSLAGGTISNLSPTQTRLTTFFRAAASLKADEADIDVVHEQLTSFSMEWLVVRVEETKFKTDDAAENTYEAWMRH